jgi:hypothetical protein
MGGGSVSALGPIRDDKREHVIQTSAGKITIEENLGHVVIKTDRLATKNVTVFLGTVFADTDVVVSVNGQFLDGAYEAGQHRKAETTTEPHVCYDDCTEDGSTGGCAS